MNGTATIEERLLRAFELLDTGFRSFQKMEDVARECGLDVLFLSECYRNRQVREEPPSTSFYVA